MWKVAAGRGELGYGEAVMDRFGVIRVVAVRFGKAVLFWFGAVGCG